MDTNTPNNNNDQFISPDYSSDGVNLNLQGINHLILIAQAFELGLAMDARAVVTITEANTIKEVVNRVSLRALERIAQRQGKGEDHGK